MTGIENLDYYVARRMLMEVRADPRISNMRPGWLADDTQWRDQLDAMDSDDCHWIAKHWDMAGGKGPAVDTSWVTMETIGGGHIWPLVVVLGIGVGAAAFALALVGWMAR